MQSNQIPTKFQIPFGKNAAVGTIRPIPVADQTATSPGAASLTTGFPPATGQPLASGGIPPSLQDFNGLLNQDTAWAWWQSAGGTVQFDQAFCNAVGGYPQGAILASTTAGLLWLNTVDNNTTNPDSASTQNWVGFVTTATLISRQIVGGNLFSRSVAGTYPFTVPAGVNVIRVRLWGGGGGGGGSTAAGNVGSGGAGGGYTDGIFVVTAGQVLTLVVGAGGAQVTNGGTTSIAGLSSAISATGGGGGVNGNNGAQNTIPTGGMGYGGANNRAGQFGGVGIAWPVFSGSTQVGTAFAGGVGGAAGLEGSLTVFAINNGIPGANPGDGGSGANNGQVAGSGQAGRIDIYY